MVARRPRPAGPPPANPRAALQDWLSLVEPDGAFLTITELFAAFPQGFEPMPAEHRTELRARVADLDTEPAGRVALRRWLLECVLEWGDQLAAGQRVPDAATARVPEHGIYLRPDSVLLDVDDPNRNRLGVFTWPLGTHLDRRSDTATAGDTWPASPVQRAETWCRESGVPLALVTDDDHWALIWVPRGAPAASCRWRTGDLSDERILQAGLVSVLGARRFFAVADDQTIERLFERAADAEAEITKGLGTSVRRSVELLVAAISRDDVAANGRVLDGVAPTEVYEAAVTVLMRLVFLLFAEERLLLPAEDPLWAESYSVLTLRDDLRSTSTRDGEDALERRATAWHRLLATFRAVHGGANHDRLSLPAYGGSLFDPGRFPFLEGRREPDRIVVNGVDLGRAGDGADGPGRPVAIDDRTVLAILDALLNIKVRSGRTTVTQRVSYKALDVEQIGHCYEGLLDHGCAPVDALSVGLVGPEGAEPEFTIADLEKHLVTGADTLCEWLADKTRCNKAPAAMAQLLVHQPAGVDLARLRVACGHDDDNVSRILPFWGIIRADLRGLPIVLLPGSQFVTQTSTRRSTGTQYTTKALAEEVARYALEPLVYEPGPQNEPDPERWRSRTPAEILDLRVCDPAVGSGAILTAAGRYLADRLIEAVVEYGPDGGPFAGRLADLVAAPADEQIVLARREVVDHCLYGVDKNPVAAEMAKLSLWLVTMARERPFTFLDHAIQVGDSLLGVTHLEQLRWLHLDPGKREGAANFETLALDLRLKEASDLARRLQDLSVVTVRDASEKQRLHDELRAKLADLSVVGDAVVGAALSTAGKGGNSLEQRLGAQTERVRTALDGNRPAIERDAAREVLHGVSTAWLRTDLPDTVPMPWDRRCLHWPLVFPEVFRRQDRSGFDAIVTNPPFLHGSKISGVAGSRYRDYMVDHIAGGERGNADLVAYFVLRSVSLSRFVGLLATNTVAQGDTREVCLDRLEAAGFVIFRALKSEKWPNEANLEISKLWICRDSSWRGGPIYLDSKNVVSISSSLEAGRRVGGVPQRLIESQGRSFVGTKTLGLGFMVSEEAVDALVEADERNREVLSEYLNGKDLSDHPEQRASRWVINFKEMPEALAKTYPECFSIVQNRVRPERVLNNDPRARRYWWQYKRPTLEMYRQIGRFDRVLAVVRHAAYPLPQFVKSAQVLSEALTVLAYDDDAHFGVCTSVFHQMWVIRYASTLETRIRYTPSDVFETFPQPQPQSGQVWISVEDAGRALNEHRKEHMIRTQLGLTKTYNRLHDRGESQADVIRLRGLHVDLDHAVRDAYGWTDLDLDHHHWDTPQGMRFMVSRKAKDELLDRLLELNQERYAAEVTAGMHGKGRTASVRRSLRSEDPSQTSLL